MRHFVNALWFLLGFFLVFGLAGQAYSQTRVKPTLPGTSIEDYSRPGWVVSRDSNHIYPTIPGTGIRDYSRPGYKREGNMIYPTLPGTSIRDWSKPGFKLVE